MFILRKVFLDGQETNFSLGEVYSFIGQEENPEEFERTMSLNKFRESTGGSAYAFIVSEGGKEIYPLFKTQYNYIMTGKGDTFANISFKMSREERINLRDNTKDAISKAAKRSLEIREAPANFSLAEVFEELKFGRPAANQRYLQEQINHLNGKNPSPGVYEMITDHKPEAEHPYSVFIVDDNDPDNAIIAGYGQSYEDALYEFIDKKDAAGYVFDENLNVTKK